MKLSPWAILGLAGAAVVLAGAAVVRIVTGFKAGQPLQLRLVTVAPGMELVEEAAKAWAAMTSAAARDGVALSLNSAFRSMEKQEQLYARFMRGEGPQAALPGYSNHQAGSAVDVETEGGTNASFSWLTANAARFRFKRTVSAEPWHWEYV